MSYVSVLYLGVFLPSTMILYQIVKRKLRWVVLLFASCLFFYLMSYWLIFFCLSATVIAYYVAKNLNQENKLAGFGIALLLGLLIFLKYSSFILSNVGIVVRFLGISEITTFKGIGIPLGISFYTLQAISYVIDVKRNQIPAEKNIARLGLYLMFFPTIMEGPIVRYKDVSTTLFNGDRLNYLNVTYGLQRVLWGLFKKVVIADRLNAFVYSIFDVNPLQHNGTIVLMGALAYTIQLYMDFSGVIDISIGTAEIFNIRIMENFRQPFFARSAAEFWKRWHVSLGLWFKEYIFYPVILSKPIKNLIKILRKKYSKHFALVISNAIALFAVWLSNGLWHGAGWRYVFFGMYYFVILTFSVFGEPFVKKFNRTLRLNQNNLLIVLFQRIRVLIIVVIGELFFRANGLNYGVSMLISIVTQFRIESFIDGNLLSFGLSEQDFLVLAIALVIVFVVSILKERGVSIRTSISSLPLPIRWTLYYCIIFAVIIFGAYGDGYTPADIIYAGF